MSLRAQAISSIKWTSVGQVGQQAAQFLTSIVLARLLLPADFGLMSMSMVAIGFLSIFRDLGTSATVIQQRELNDDLVSGLFWVNAAIGLLFMTGLLVGAPLVAWFYREPRVIPMTRALAIVFFISSLGAVQKSLLERNLRFGTIAKIETFVMILSSAVAIAAAFFGAGVWSLILRAALDAVLSTSLLALLARFLPRLRFNWRELKRVSGYSLSLTGFNVANFFTRNADYLLIGRFLGARDLGYYTLAYKLMLFPLQNISVVIARVMFPVFSRMQDDDERFQRAYLKVTNAIAVVAFPLMLGLLALSKPFVVTVFGTTWQPVALLLTVLAPVGMVQAIGTTVGGIYQAKGRTDWMFAWGLGSGLLSVLAFAIGLRWGILGVAAAYALVEVVIFYPSFAIPFRLIHLKFADFLVDLWRPFLCSTLMLLLLVLALPFSQAHLSTRNLVLTMVPFGATTYLLWSLLLNRKGVQRISELAFPSWTGLSARAPEQ